MIKAVIFDVDGTLIDSNDFHAQAWQKAFAEKGFEFSFEEIRPQIGKGADTLMPEFLSPEEIKKYGDEIATRRGEIFKDEYLDKVKPFSQVRELFERIKADDKKIALASSAKKDELQEYKKIADIEDLVEEETSTDDAEESKPEPDIFEAALKLLGDPKKSEVIVVGDTPYDATAAAKAGIKTIGVLCGGFSKENLSEAVEIYQNPAELLEKYDQSSLSK